MQTWSTDKQDSKICTESFFSQMLSFQKDHLEWASLADVFPAELHYQVLCNIMIQILLMLEPRFDALWGSYQCIKTHGHVSYSVIKSSIVVKIRQDNNRFSQIWQKYTSAANSSKWGQISADLVEVGDPPLCRLVGSWQPSYIVNCSIVSCIMTGEHCIHLWSSLSNMLP